MSDDKEEFAELYRIAELARRFPQLCRAIGVEKPAIAAAEVKPTARDMPFLTRVTDSPLIAEGFLGPDCIWYVRCFHVVADAEFEPRIEEAIAEGREDDFYIPVDGLAEDIIKWAIPRFRASTQAPEAHAMFERRLAASRFAEGLTLH